MYKYSGNVNFEILGHLGRAGCATKVRRVRKAFRISEEILWNAARVRKAGNLKVVIHLYKCPGITVEVQSLLKNIFIQESRPQMMPLFLLYILPLC